MDLGACKRFALDMTWKVILKPFLILHRLASPTEMVIFGIMEAASVLVLSAETGPQGLLHGCCTLGFWTWYTKRGGFASSYFWLVTLNIALNSEFTWFELSADNPMLLPKAVLA